MHAHTFDGHNGQELVFVFWEPIKRCLPVGLIISECRQAKHKRDTAEEHRRNDVLMSVVVVVVYTTKATHTQSLGWAYVPDGYKMQQAPENRRLAS